MDEDVKLILGKRLREIRKSKKMTLEDLGVAIGLEESSASTRISRYETGVHSIEINTAERIAKVLNVPLSLFYAPTDDLAELNRIFYSLDKSKQTELLSFAKQLEQNA